MTTTMEKKKKKIVLYLTKRNAIHKITDTIRTIKLEICKFYGAFKDLDKLRPTISKRFRPKPFSGSSLLLPRWTLVLELTHVRLKYTLRHCLEKLK